MIGPILAALLTAATAEPASTLPTATPPPAPAEIAPSPLAEAQANVDRAEQLYTQSCGDRAYGSYDDICSQIANQVHRYRVDLDRQRSLAAHAAKAPAVQPRPVAPLSAH